MQNCLGNWGSVGIQHKQILSCLRSSTGILFFRGHGSRHSSVEYVQDNLFYSASVPKGVYMQFDLQTEISALFIAIILVNHSNSIITYSPLIIKCHIGVS